MTLLSWRHELRMIGDVLLFGGILALVVSVIAGLGGPRIRAENRRDQIAGQTHRLMAVANPVTSLHDPDYVGLNDPFSPARSDSVPAANPQPEVARPRPPLPPFRLAGTIRSSRGGWRAIVQAAAEPAKLVGNGDTLHAFIVKSVKRGIVVLASSDTSLVLRLPGK